jgi:YD repeat-containing protein
MVMGCCPEGAGVTAKRTFLAALLAALMTAGAARAAEVETRDFQVLVDGKPVGNAQMTIKKQEDGVTVMTCDTDIKVKILVRTYSYIYRGQEVWKDARLQNFDSTCNDDGKLYKVAAVAEGTQLRVKVNNEESLVRGDVWLSSYWRQPDADRVNKVVPILEADTGKPLEALVTYVGQEQRPVAGQPATVHHFRLQGQSTVDLWYDASGRLIRQEWTEEGHRTGLELLRLRR